jgi:hypothetical protein
MSPTCQDTLTVARLGVKQASHGRAYFGSFGDSLVSLECIAQHARLVSFPIDQTVLFEGGYLTLSQPYHAGTLHVGTRLTEPAAGSGRFRPVFAGVF